MEEAHGLRLTPARLKAAGRRGTTAAAPPQPPSVSA